MPFQDFDNTEAEHGSYNWGYKPVNFSSPDGWYATKIVGPERVTEFKKLVHALHERFPLESCPLSASPLYPYPEGEPVHAQMPEEQGEAAPRHLH